MQINPETITDFFSGQRPAPGAELWLPVDSHMSVTAQHRKLDIVSDKAVIAIELIRIATKNLAYFHNYVCLRDC